MRNRGVVAILHGEKLLAVTPNPNVLTVKIFEGTYVGKEFFDYSFEEITNEYYLRPSYVKLDCLR